MSKKDYKSNNFSFPNIDCMQKYKEQYFSAAMLPSMVCCLPTVER